MEKLRFVEYWLQRCPSLYRIWQRAFGSPSHLLGVLTTDSDKVLALAKAISKNLGARSATIPTLMTIERSRTLAAEKQLDRTSFEVLLHSSRSLPPPLKGCWDLKMPSSGRPLALKPQQQYQQMTSAWLFFSQTRVWSLTGHACGNTSISSVSNAC